MSLKNDLRKRLLDDMIKQVCATEQNAVLVVDPTTADILSSCCRMYDVMDVGVLALQTVKVKREKLAIPAIYFITPTRASVKTLCEDFANSKAPQYSRAHVFFSERVPSEVMSMISNSNAVDYIQTFTELNINFIATEARVFTFGRKKVIPQLFFPVVKDKLADELKMTARQLASVLCTMNERPYIRYAGASALSRTMAQLVEAELTKMAQLMPDWTPNAHRERGTLLLVDRALDPVAPVMHEFTYQAMVNDLLNIDGELIELASEVAEQKTDDDAASSLVLSEDDSLWMEFRHEHIANVLKDVTKKFAAFKNENKMAQLQSSRGDDSKASVKDMMAAMKSMPEYKSMIRKYHKHLSIAAECMDVFNKKQLKELGDLEQDMVTGMNENGGKLDQKGMTNALISKCQSQFIGVVEKLRLLMIYIASVGGLADSTRDQLLQGVDSRLQRAVRNLSKLGVAAGKDGRGIKHSKTRVKEFERRARDIPLALMRYAPLLYTVVQQLCADELSTGDYPFHGDSGGGGGGGKKKSARRRQKGTVRSARKQNNKGAWRPGEDGDKGGAGDDDTSRVIVFMLGGVTFSEIRSCYEIDATTDAVNVFVGSTGTLNAHEYVRGLADLDEADTLTGPAPVRRSGGGRGGGSDDDDDPIDFDSIRIE